MPKLQTKLVSSASTFVGVDPYIKFLRQHDPVPSLGIERQSSADPLKDIYKSDQKLLRIFCSKILI
jgi:hypothetical protein